MTRDIKLTVDIAIARKALGVAGFNCEEIRRATDDDIFKKVLSMIECYGAVLEAETAEAGSVELASLCELIDRLAIFKEINRRLLMSTLGATIEGRMSNTELLAILSTAPVIKAEPVIHARWEMIEKEAFWVGDEGEWLKTGIPTKRAVPVCSHCQTEFGTAVLKYKRCPECGAVMDL